MNNRRLVICAIACILVMILQACGGGPGSTPIPEREAKIPANAVKMTSLSDEHPPVLHTAGYEEPVPLPGGVNTAGGEDSPFITPDGNTLYFFFTPDVSIPAEKQILDGVTGIYVSHKGNGEWSRAERILLQDPGKLAGDGCEFVLGDIMWFCSAREGVTGFHWFTAEYKNGSWQNWQLADFDPDYKVGELHITGDGTELYFASDRAEGKGNLDIWVSKKAGGKWQEPLNVSAVNTPDSEGWPAISPSGDELWFSRNYAIWRSKKVNGEWQEAEQIVSSLAGEPSIDASGNVYFVHHFYIGDKMIEADIYVAYKK